MSKRKRPINSGTNNSFDDAGEGDPLCRLPPTAAVATTATAVEDDAEVESGPVTPRYVEDLASLTMRREAQAHNAPRPVRDLKDPRFGPPEIAAEPEPPPVDLSFLPSAKFDAALQATPIAELFEKTRALQREADEAEQRATDAARATYAAAIVGVARQKAVAKHAAYLAHVMAGKVALLPAKTEEEVREHIRAVLRFDALTAAAREAPQRRATWTKRWMDADRTYFLAEANLKAARRSHQFAERGSAAEAAAGRVVEDAALAERAAREAQHAIRIEGGEDDRLESDLLNLRTRFADLFDGGAVEAVIVAGAKPTK